MKIQDGCRSCCYATESRAERTTLSGLVSLRYVWATRWRWWMAKTSDWPTESDVQEKEALSRNNGLRACAMVPPGWGGEGNPQTTGLSSCRTVTSATGSPTMCRWGWRSSAGCIPRYGAASLALNLSVWSRKLISVRMTSGINMS